MNLGKTQALIAQKYKELTPDSGEHWMRFLVGWFMIGLGGTDIVIHRFIQGGPWEKEPIGLIVFGVSIVFTKKVIALLAFWKSRSG